MIPLWFTLCHFYWFQLSNYIQNYIIGVPSQHMNGILCCNERHPLLLKCFVTFLRCIRRVGKATDGIYEPLKSHHVISAKTNSQSAYKIPDLRHPLSRRNGMLWYNERHALLLKCFITFLWCMRRMGRASESIYEPIIVHIVSYSTGVSFQLAYKLQDLGYPLNIEMEYCATRRDINCCWNVS